MNPPAKAVFWALWPALLLAPALLWLGQRFTNELGDEATIRVGHTLELRADAVQRTIDRIDAKLGSLEAFAAGQTAGGLAIDGGRFATFAAGLHASATWIRAFQFVSDGVVTQTYPLEGNEAVLGYNLLAHPKSIVGADVIRARETGRPTVTGPLELVQGGLGIIIRRPLPRSPGQPAQLVAAVLNIAPLLAESGFGPETADGIQFAIRRPAGEVFFGPATVFEGRPVVRRLSLPDGSWVMGACPRLGWLASTRGPVLRFRLAGGAIIFLLCALVFTLAHGRANLAEEVRARTDELRSELAERMRAEQGARASEATVRELNATLEGRVSARTAELAVARDRAEAADRLKSAFLATMSHELRTPLNSIIGFTGILLQGLAGPLNPEQTKQLDMVRGSARHLLSLINDVLDISKIEAGQLQVTREAFDLPASVERVVGIVRPLAEKKGLELRADVAPGIGEAVNDRRRFEQVLLNLLNNAVKFTERGGVSLTAIVEAADGAGRSLRVAVADTGIGIKPEDLQELFQPFRQIDSGLTRQHEGTGLGLAICRRLAGLMGGTMEAASAWGKGSVFTLTLPIGSPAAEARTSGPGAGA